MTEADRMTIYRDVDDCPQLSVILTGVESPGVARGKEWVVSKLDLVAKMVTITRNCGDDYATAFAQYSEWGGETET